MNKRSKNSEIVPLHCLLSILMEREVHFGASVGGDREDLGKCVAFILEILVTDETKFPDLVNLRRLKLCKEQLFAQNPLFGFMWKLLSEKLSQMGIGFMETVEPGQAQKIGTYFLGRFQPPFFVQDRGRGLQLVL